MPKVREVDGKNKGQLRSSTLTVGDFLKENTAFLDSHGIESPFLHSLILLSKVLGKSREFLIAHPEHEIGDKYRSILADLIRRVAQGEPMAYLTGEKEFWSMHFLCSPAALIPRPETELLVEKAMEWWGRQGPKVILDLGTGTGAVGITLADIWKESVVFLTDIDMGALLLARKNTERLLGPSARVLFLCGDWFQPFRRGFRAGLITVNPPYVSRSDEDLLHESVRRFEPKTALYSRDGTGLSEIRCVFSEAANHLVAGGLLLCEVGAGQAQAVASFAEGLGFYGHIKVFQDLSGTHRVVAASL